MTKTQRAEKERPILMSAPMVRAILAGTKTQTRRALNAYRLRFFRAAAAAGEISDFLDTGTLEENDPSYINDHCPYGQPGDRLWVKETWRTRYDFDRLKPTELRSQDETKHGAGIYFEADGRVLLTGKVRQSIFMRRWMSRIALEITDVRVERLQGISEEDAKAEGVNWAAAGYNAAHETPCAAYKTLWESINGAGSWAKNPWVWKIEFKRINFPRIKL